jgi:peptidoglycan/xylan/chitin deacetylase (PgdA/CDA1 family)
MYQGKIELYRAARRTGLFRAARRATRSRLRILGYHGFASDDECEFRPKLFISRRTFRRRLDTIRSGGFRIINLDEALAQLRNGSIEPDCVVITIDDGFASTLSIAAPALKEYEAKATVYLTTYYMCKQVPVFDLAMAYIVWKASTKSVTIDHPHTGLPWHLDLSTAAARERTTSDLVQFGRAMGSEPSRLELLRCVAAAGGVKGDVLELASAFRLMSFDEARRLLNYGIDVGLHTHRHRFPTNDLGVCRSEVEENRELLNAQIGFPPRHFCYPSGIYGPDHGPLLRSLGVLSAATCDTGLVRAGDSPFAMKRFLDGEMVADIEFEAELWGFAELMRLSLRRGRSANPAASV